MPNTFNKLDKIHSYPAKFTLETAEKYIKLFTKEKDTIYDPFVGSGTSLLAGTMLNRKSIGTDINGVAVALSNFKLLYFNKTDIADINNFLIKLKEKFNKKEYGDHFYYKSIEHWFCNESIIALSGIKNCIKENFDKESKLNVFFKIALSTIINKVSNQESDTRYAAITKKIITINYVLDLFYNKVINLIDIVSDAKRDKYILDNSVAYLLNAKLADKIIPEKSVNLIITSPPYPNTYDYYLYHKHRMIWIDEDFRFAMNEEIGSRREFSSQKQPGQKFTKDLENIFTICNLTLKKHAKIVIIIGDGKIQGKMYDSYKNTINVCNKIGWNLISSSCTKLDDTSRSFQKSFRTKGKKEHLLIFEK